MNLPVLLRTIGWMVLDTLRQSLASRLFWITFGMSVLVILFCLSVRASDFERLPTSPNEDQFGIPIYSEEGKKLSEQQLRELGLDPLGKDRLSLGFGLMEIRTARGKQDSVRFVQVWLAGLVAGTVGIFLAIIWTAGFLPSFLEPTQATVLLAKPIPRWALLLGKVLGVLLFALIQTVIFVMGTWLALGFSTGVFDARYFWAIPVLLLHFTVFYSFSAMIAVWTRSTVVCVFATLIFWVICWGMNFARHSVVVHNPQGLTSLSRGAVEVGYWCLPKPADMNMIFDETLETQGFAAEVPEFRNALSEGKISLGWSAVASLLFAGAMFLVAAVELRKADY